MPLTFNEKELVYHQKFTHQLKQNKKSFFFSKFTNFKPFVVKPFEVFNVLGWFQV